MRVVLRRSGGFANIPSTREIDSADLTPGESAELSRLIAGAELNTSSDMRAWPDAFQYELTIENDSGTHTYRTTDASMPGGWRPLMEWLIRRP
jgi:hypothetical protein